MTSDSEADEELDPRVQGELESLNRATDDINKWENEMSVEREKFKLLLNHAIQQLTSRGKKLEKSIARARFYYETMKDVKQAQAALERAVQNFQKSNGIHRAAKETISLAEQRLSEFSDPKVDGAWQEMLNIQTIRFMEAERDRTRSERIHKQAASKYDYLQKKANKFKQKHKYSVAKTRNYYEIKEKLEAELQKQQQRVTELQEKIKSAKSRYQNALSNLEKISSEIHQQRTLAKLKLELPERGAVEGSEDPDEDLSTMAKIADFNLKREKTYDDIEALEADLEEFDFENCSSEEEEWSDEEGSESSESSGRLTSSSRGFRRQASNCSIDEPLGVSKNKKRSFRKKKSLSRQDSLLENVFESDQTMVSNEDITNKTSKESNSDDVTYDTLHGSSASNANPVKREEATDEYDIFEDLC